MASAMSRTSLLSVLDDFARYGRDVAVVQERGYRRGIWTYGQLRQGALRVAALLASRGIAPGDRVLLLGKSSAEWLAAFWGILARRAVAVPLDPSSTPDFVASVLRDAKVRFAFADRALLPQLSACQTTILDELNAAIAGFSEDEGRAACDNALTRDTVAEILFTSGTTAEPRGVVLTHGNFLANLEPLERGIEPYRKWERWFHPLRFVTLVPLSHVFGQFMGLMVPPLLGATVVFEGSANPAEIIRTVKRERATALIAVPRMLDALRNGLLREIEARGWGSWFASASAKAHGQHFLRRAWRFRRLHRRFGWKFWAFVSGGAALSAETEEFFRRLGYAVAQGYGMTETASLISLNHPFHAAQGSVGKILPGQEIRLAEDGEILVRSASVAAGYLQGGTLRPLSENGWIRTGDLGELDAEGNLRFRGRKKNVVVTPAGLNIYPEDLESALNKQPAVKESVVVPLEREGNAEPCTVLLLNAGKGDAEAGRKVIEAANVSLAEYQRIRSWVVWPEPDFPRTPTGKPRLSVIAARAAEMLAGGPGLSQQRGDLESLMARFASAEGPVPLERELDLSSLDRVELMSALEERYQVELNETSFAEAKSVADVERLLADAGARPAKRGARRTDTVYPRWTQREAVRWLRLAIYYALVWPATQILAHPKIVGREHLRVGRPAAAQNVARGPVLVVSNHITRRADIGLILAALPLRFRHRLAIAMGGETLQNMLHPPRNWLFLRRWAYQLGYWLVTALFNVFPLPQRSDFRESFRFAGESVDRGYSVLVFPEGEVTNDGRMAAFQSGIGLLAENLGIPIVPMRLDGVWQMKSERRRWAHRGEVTVRIGAPVTYPAGTPPETIARDLETRVKSL
ncbi:MAG: AMP-binding protein [Acidobacteria bacterium]|nr:MAG: AMP-binding protein [Acidobacteriota bacterium]